MKILSQINPESWKHEFQCKKCDTVCEACHTDVKVTYSEADGPHPASEYFYLQCPVCRAEKSLADTTVPQIIFVETRKRCPKRVNSGFGPFDR